MEKYSADAESLMAVLRRLRAPDGCPWDRKQTRESLVRHLSSETAELIDAIEQNDPQHICEELGDVLMNIFFQVVVAEEKGEFTLTDVWQGIVDKMIRRHRHVFGDAKAENAEDVVAIWAAVKAAERADEKKPESLLDEVKPSLSALERAEKLQKKAAQVGFDWQDSSGVLAKIREEVDEVDEALKSGDDENIDEELGDLLFAVSNLIRFRERGDSETLLRAANRKFERRFRAVESAANAEGGFEAFDLNGLDRLWETVKSRENKNGL